MRGAQQWFYNANALSAADSGPTPLTIFGGDLLAWYSASSTDNMTLDGGNNVTQLDDLSGNDYHFVVASFSNAPSYGDTPNQLNGYDTITFDPSNSEGMVMSNCVPSDWNRLYNAGVGTASTVIYIHRGGPTGSGGLITFANRTGSPLQYGFQMALDDSPSQDRWFAQQSGGVGSRTAIDSPNPITIGQFGVYGFISRKVSSTFHIDAILDVDSVVANANSTTKLPQPPDGNPELFARAANSDWFEGSMAELIIVGKTFSSSEVNDLKTYLNNTWGYTYSVT